eukprot:gene33325-40312_t
MIPLKRQVPLISEASEGIKRRKQAPHSLVHIVEREVVKDSIEKALIAYRAYVRCIQAFDTRLVSQFMSSHCHEAVILSVAWEHEMCLGGQAYMELRGLQAVQSYLQIICGIYPDTVLEFGEVSTEATTNTALPCNNGDCIVSAKVMFGAHQIYGINVTDLSCAFNETEALSGLTSFIHSCRSSPQPPESCNDCSCSSDQSASSLLSSSSAPMALLSTVSVEDACVSSAGPAVSHAQAPEAFIHSASSLETHPLDNMSIFISTEHARFSRGQKYPSIVEIKLRGSLQLFVGEDGKIVRIKYTF